MTQNQNGLTLQDLLAEFLDLSRNKAKSLLDRRRVFVNGTRVWMARHTLKKGDLLEIQKNQAESRSQPILTTLYEDRHLLIIDKPAGIETTGTASAEERLRMERNEPGLHAVHRLDRDTTGCWLVARTLEAHARAIEQFTRREIHKFYHAIARGFIQDAERAIRNPLDGLPAITLIKRLGAQQTASHLLVKIETGRTHQIRRHLAALGHPILGDANYSGKQPLSPMERKVPRQMLHASEIRFAHPATGEILKVVSPLPADFKQCLRQFRL